MQNEDNLKWAVFGTGVIANEMASGLSEVVGLANEKGLVIAEAMTIGHTMAEDSIKLPKQIIISSFGSFRTNLIVSGVQL